MSTTIIKPQKNTSCILEKVKVIGIGNAGVKIVDKLASHQEAAWLEIAAVDTDTASINRASLKNKFIVGEEWTKGLGCGGNVIKGERAIAHKSNIAVKDFMNNASLVILVGGLGGGTATGGMPGIARFTKDKHIPVILIITVPFSFEGHSKREIAETQIINLMRTPYTIVPIPNDLLYSTLPASTSFEKAFDEANIEVARAVLGIAELLRCDSSIAVDLCDFHNIVTKAKAECGIGIGFATLTPDKDRTQEALNNLLDSPLLGGRQRLKNADALIISLTGGIDLTIGEMKYALDKITEMAGEKTEIAVGANTDEAYNGKIQLTVIPITYDKAAPTSEGPQTYHGIGKQLTHTSIIRQIRTLKKQDEDQPELPLGTTSRGIFTSTTQSIIEGQDMDIPTFQRKEIHIDKGR